MSAAALFDALEARGVRFFAGVPDSYLHAFCAELSRRYPAERNVVAANEGGAVAIACGHYLATGEAPLVYMQNSGLGNAVNPLASLTNPEMLGVPMLLLVGWRGDPYHGDHVQHALQGRATPALLDALGIPHVELPCDDLAAAAAVAEALRLAREAGGPAAMLVPKGVLSTGKSPVVDGSPLPSREEAICAVLDAAPPDAIFSATTGRASRELFHVREARGEGHAHDFLNVGSMGHASSVALGIALAHPERRVVCLDGDAALIMHMGLLAPVSKLDVPNLLHVVLNNGLHESVGGQPSAGGDVSFTAIARACGYATADGPASSPGEAAAAIRSLCGLARPAFLDFRIRGGIRGDMPGLEVDPKAMREGLMDELGAL